MKSALLSIFIVPFQASKTNAITSPFAPKSTSILPREEELPMDEWYTKYSSYPPYCSTPDQMSQRHIPPLDSKSRTTLETNIVHVTAIIRHGTRTPSKAHQCWDGFWSSDSDTSTWNCELKTMMAPPSPDAIRQCELNPTICDDNDNSTTDGKGAMFLFEKEYNALHSPPQLRNELNGTCQVGQLLLRGYAQELHNGQMLRKTYVIEDDDIDSNVDKSMALFDFSLSSENTNSTKNSSDATGTSMNQRPYEAPSLYYRADDDQRTLMSGQILLRGLFGDLLARHAEELGPHTDPTIVVHTADRSRDILSHNEDVCPRLTEMAEQIQKSTEYKELFETTENSQQLKLFMKEELGGEGDAFRSSIKDCMMSTICTDRTLPPILDDYEKETENHYAAYGTDLFDRLQKYVSYAVPLLCLIGCHSHFSNNANMVLLLHTSPTYRNSSS